MSATVEATAIARPHFGETPKADPCILVIFGASGDLAKRKLLPSVYNLVAGGFITNKFDLLGVGRESMAEDEFRKMMREATGSAKEAHHFKPDTWGKLENVMSYMGGDTADPATYKALAQRIAEMQKAGSAQNVVYYLSTPASIAPSIIQGLGAAGLVRRDGIWTRIVVEKPFGRDLASAAALNEELLQVFREKEIYRIDHYLGKETVQNLLVFRFGNSIFEPIWNRNYIEYVEITAAETLGVGTRTGFYEETGALRDMVANHILQLLTITAMEPPVAFEADAVREQKVQVLRSISPMTIEQVAARTIRGQYGPGMVDGQRVPGYREEPGVNKHSVTETFAAVEFHIENWRWAGVPFYIRTGKRLSRPLTQIDVHLKRTPQALFAKTPLERVDPNDISIRIQPDEGIGMTFAAKTPGSAMHTAQVRMDFSYKDAFGGEAPVAYETLLLDVMRGDATLFTRRDEVEAEWRLITPIEEAWAQLPPPQFPNYPAGGAGPTAVEALVHRNGHEWLDLNLGN